MLFPLKKSSLQISVYTFHEIKKIMLEGILPFTMSQS